MNPTSTPEYQARNWIIANRLRLFGVSPSTSEAQKMCEDDGINIDSTAFMYLVRDMRNGGELEMWLKYRTPISHKPRKWPPRVWREKSNSVLEALKIWKDGHPRVPLSAVCRETSIPPQNVLEILKEGGKFVDLPNVYNDLESLNA